VAENREGGTAADGRYLQRQAMSGIDVWRVPVASDTAQPTIDSVSGISKARTQRHQTG
jgi:hypothetical protein